MFIKLFFAILLTMLSVRSDYKCFKIKNIITYPFIFIGLIINIYTNTIISSLLGTFLPFLCLYILYHLNYLGGGDIKLFCALGALMGIEFIQLTIIYSFIFGGIISFYLLTYKKRVITLKDIRINIKYHILICMLFKNIDIKKSQIKIHFSYSIAIGVFCSFITAL
jgi:prepilin peptidase CpaA